MLDTCEISEDLMIGQECHLGDFVTISSGVEMNTIKDTLFIIFALRAKNQARHLCDLRPLLGERNKAKA